jgi:hypothetical protein
MATADDYAAWIVANKDKKGTPEFATVAAAYQEAKGESAAQPKAPEQPQRTLGESAARAGGLGIRDIVQGAMSLPNLIADPVNATINAGIYGVNKMAGTNIPSLDLPSRALPKLLTQAGLPEPQTGAEHFTGAVNQALTGFAPMLKGAQMATRGAQELPFIKSMLTKPIAETAQVVTGAGASEGVKQGGGGTAAQMIAGAIAPMGVSGIANVTSRVAGGLNDLRRPLTQGGAEQIAGDVLGRITQDKGTALRNLQKYNQLVESGAQVGSPGFKPTAGAVSGDYGLVGGQQLISRGDASPQFAQRFAANNEAHAADLGKLNATEKMLEFYRNKRDEITTPMREAVLSASENAPGIQVQHHVDFGPVAERLGAIAATAAGGKAESQKALQWVAGRLQKYQQESRTDPRNAYALYQDIGDLVAGKIKDDNGASLRLAGGLANDAKKVLGQQIELAAPGFKKYLEHYARLSKPIDRLEVITAKLGDEGLSKVTNAMPTVTDNGASYVLSQAKVKNAVQGINAETKLAPRQRDVLGRVLADLNAETFASRGGKQPGSDTYQNIASANFVNRMLGETLGSSGLGKAIQAPLNFVNRPFESRINDLIVQAYQDPKLMEKLLRKARTNRDSPTLAGLLQDTGNTGGAGLLGSVFSR